MNNSLRFIVREVHTTWCMKRSINQNHLQTTVINNRVMRELSS
uniref:Uncharacterized protein n=1 Tax=Anguilla anguilla TaxID=7936 RepID=A0A0E9T348_ANGAN